MKISEYFMRPYKFLFVAISVATSTFSYFAWQFEDRYLIFGVLFTLSLLLGARVLTYEKPRRAHVYILMAIFVVGQWWFFETLLTFLFWKVIGFA